MKIEKYFDKQLKKEMWRIDVTVSNRRHRRGKFETRRQAEIAVSGLIVLAQNNQNGLPSLIKPITVDELLDTAKVKCPRPLQHYLIEIFRASVDPQKPVIDLKRMDMANFWERLNERNLKSGTLSQYKGLLYSILNRAGEWFIELDDWYPPKSPRMEKSEARARVLTIDELVKIFSAWQRPDCYPRESLKWKEFRLELMDIAKLMLLTAARREELEKVSMLAIDRRERWLRLQSGKTGRWHAIPLNETALELLERHAGRTPMFSKFPSSTIHYVCQRVGQAAGLPSGQKLDHGWSFHDLRRTAATYIESNGIAYSAVKATLGHRRQDITSVYTPAQITELRRASDLLEIHWREIDGILCEQCDPCKFKTA